jgi:hypothetical protein
MRELSTRETVGRNSVEKLPGGSVLETRLVVEWERWSLN